MSLFDADEFAVCPLCHGEGFVYDEKVDAAVACKKCRPHAAAPAPREIRQPVSSDPSWPSHVPSAQVIAMAKARQEAGDRIDPNGMKNIGSPEERLQGHAAEAVLAWWLDTQAANYEWDGGPNYKPDFIIYGHSVGVRITAVKSSSLTRRSLIYIFDRHYHGVEDRFFLGVDRSSGRYYLLGGTTLAAFRETAWLCDVGEEVCRGFIARHKMWVNRVSLLEPPDSWLVSMRERTAVAS